MTPSAPTPASTAIATRTRVKWENIGIVLIGAVAATFAVVGILAAGESSPTKPAAEPVAPATQLADDPVTSDTAAGAGALSMSDAEGLIEEARALIAEGRWDEATDRLDTIPEEFRALVGADAVRGQLDSARSAHEALTAELTAAVEARQWKDAKALLARIAKLAPLDATLLETQAAVDAALAPPAVRPAAADTDPAADTAGGGAGSTGAAAAKPAGATTRPATSRPATSRPAAGSSSRPAATTRPATSRPTTTRPAVPAAGGGGVPSAPSTPAPATGAGSVTGAGTTAAGSLGITLSAEQQQQLEAALAEALAGGQITLG